MSEVRRFDGENGSVREEIGVVYMDSDALKKLKKKGAYVDWTARKEWEFKVFKEPAGLMIDHFGDTTVLSKGELEDLAYGRVKFSRYPQIPRYMYASVMRKATEALGIIYRPYMTEAATPPKVKKVRLVLPKPKPWDVALKKSEELKVYLEKRKDEIDRLEKFVKALKEMEKK